MVAAATAAAVRAGAAMVVAARAVAKVVVKAVVRAAETVLRGGDAMRRELHVYHAVHDIYLRNSLALVQDHS